MTLFSEYHMQSKSYGLSCFGMCIGNTTTLGQPLRFALSGQRSDT